MFTFECELLFDSRDVPIIQSIFGAASFTLFKHLYNHRDSYDRGLRVDERLGSGEIAEAKEDDMSLF